jgi:lauroyl/myristoyl acyltransferase
MTGAPILVGSFPRDTKDIGRFITKAHPVFLNTDNKERTKESIEQLTKDIIMEMEELIKQDPLQWCMLQKFFVD